MSESEREEKEWHRIWDGERKLERKRMLVAYRQTVRKQDQVK